MSTNIALNSFFLFASIIPRLDFAQAVKLLQKGVPTNDVIQAIERIRNYELKKQVELYVSSSSSSSNPNPARCDQVSDSQLSGPQNV